MYFVYILFSQKLNRFYAGQTHDLEKRLNDHHLGRSKYTRKGIPWTLITSFSFVSRAEAVNLESRIKSRGIRRFLQDMNFDFNRISPDRVR